MKFLFDLFPIILFFIAFKIWDIYAATGVAIAATIAQIGYLKARGRKVETMMWVSLAIIVVFGGATILLHDETFIKWKPSVLYWMFAVILAGAQLIWRKNLIRALMQAQKVELPDHAWNVLNWSWVGFFTFMGGLNLYVAYEFSTDAWVNFKLFGGMGLMIVFVIGQAFYMARFIEEKPEAKSGTGTPE